MRSHTHDLTEGNILQKLVAVASPIMGMQFLQMAYNLTDMFFLGRIGRDAVAASGMAGMYLWLSVGLMVIGRLGAEIGVSQNLGRGDAHAARAYSHNALTLALLFGVGYGLMLFLFRAPLVGVFGMRETEVIDATVVYLAVIAIGMPFAFLNAAISGTFNGAGNSRVPFVTNGVGFVLNIVLNPIFIFALDMGIRGAAWATVVAQAIVLVLHLLAITVYAGRPFDAYQIFVRPSRKRMREILRWGIPVSIESLAFTMLSMVLSRFVAYYGADAMAVKRIGIQLESFSWLIAGGFSSALTAFVGQNYGRGQFARIHDGTRLGRNMMLAWGVICTIIPWVFGRQMFALFLPDDAAVLDMGVTFMRILSVCQLFLCLEGWAVGVFRGMGKTLPPTICTVTGNTLRIPLSYVLSLMFGLPGLWWGMSLGACLRGIALVTWNMIHARTMPQEDKEPAVVS